MINSTYETLHEHEGLFNSLFRRFSNKHPTKEEAEAIKAEKKLIKKSERYHKKGSINKALQLKKAIQKLKSHKNKSNRTKSCKINLCEMFDLLEVTRTVHFVASGGDKRMPTRQEIAFLFRTSNGPVEGNLI